MFLSLRKLTVPSGQQVYRKSTDRFLYAESHHHPAQNLKLALQKNEHDKKN